MVIVGIIGVLVAVGFPLASSILPDYRLRAAVRDIRSNLQLAKITAVRRNTRCVVAFTPGVYTPQGRIGSFEIFMDTNKDWSRLDADGNDEETLAPVQTMPANVSLVQAVFVDNGNGQADSTFMVGFDTHGLCARSLNGPFVFGQVQLQNSKGKTALVQISPAGNISLP